MGCPDTKVLFSGSSKSALVRRFFIYIDVMAGNCSCISRTSTNPWWSYVVCASLHECSLLEQCTTPGREEGERCRKPKPRSNCRGAHKRLLGIALVCGCLATLPAHAVPCKLEQPAEPAQVSYVIDGDTVILDDDRHIRLIGLNAPEIGRDGKPAQVGAHSARKKLISILTPLMRVKLLYDNERQDRYSRTLAHLFLPDGSNIQAKLLAAGHATPLTVPPNLHYLDCYIEVSGQAIQDKQGLWALADYAIRDIQDLGTGDKGYMRLHARVDHVSYSHSSLWVNLLPHGALRIVKEDLQYFDKVGLENLAGKNIQFRGWLYKRNGQFRMRIRHPVDIEIRN